MPSNQHKEEITKALTKALRDVFGTGVKTQRFIDVGRIPLLCKSVIEMRGNIKKTNEDIKVIKENQQRQMTHIEELKHAVQNTQQKETTQEIEDAKRAKWVERFKSAGFNTLWALIMGTITLILIRTHIIDLRAIFIQEVIK